VSNKDENECMLWKGGKSSAGYGYYTVNKKNWRVHRLSYYLAHNQIDDKLVIRHLCNNKLCVNPEHLAEGTQKENIQDQITAGTFVYGEKNGRAKLCSQNVIDIRESKDLLSVLSQRYDVSVALISRIKLGKSWKHVKSD
jgi:hypothetical protein